MFSHLSNNFKGIILAIVGFTSFAMADANAKFLTQSYDSVQIVGTSAVFTSFLCLVIAPFLGGLKKTLHSKKLKFHIGRGVMNVIISLLVVFSFSKLTLAGTYSMIFATPFVVSILAIPIFKERVTKHGWVAIAVGFAGVLVVVRPGLSDINPYLFVPLICTLFIAGLFLFARALDDKETLVSLAFYPAFANFILITPLAVYLYGFDSLQDAPMFLMQAILIIIGLTFTALAFRIAKASIISPFMYFEIIWAIGFDKYLFHEAPDIWTLLGAAIIIASGLYLIETERRQMQLGTEHV